MPSYPRWFDYPCKYSMKESLCCINSPSKNESGFLALLNVMMSPLKVDEQSKV